MEKKKLSIGTVIILLVIVAAIAVGATYMITKTEKQNTNSNGVEKKTSNSDISKESDVANSEIPKNNTEDKKDSEDKYFILYEGKEIENKTGIQNLSDMKITNEANTKYNTKYYNYENGKYVGEKTGTFGERTTEGESCVENVSKIAISKKTDALPRTYSTIKELPKELEEMADYSSVEINKIDLDGDGKEEYIVCYTVDYKEGEIGDGEPEASSGIMLLDSNYKKVADLAILKNGFWGDIKEESSKVFLSLKDVDYIDLDNDGIMEILIKVPQYEGSQLSILKYNKGKIDGKTNLEVNVSK